MILGLQFLILGGISGGFRLDFPKFVESIIFGFPGKGRFPRKARNPEFEELPG